MKLKRIQLLFLIFHCGYRTALSLSNHSKTFRNFRNIIGMAHPANGFRGDIRKKLAAVINLYFNLADGQVREVVGSMKEYEDALLTRPEFMRIHRSYIVNMLQIEELSPTGLRTFSGRELPVSRLLYPQLQKDYMKLLFAQREE